jgi:mono/diheme cytochrome c family protein
MPKIGSLLIACFVGFPAIVLGVSMTASLQEPAANPQQDSQTRPLIASVEGQDLYRAYCASCHGREANGKGPAAPALKSPVPDLTTIAHRNNGIFPRERIRRIIAGDDALVSHGSTEMPIWGPVFHQVERDRDWGNVRLENLAKYLESIQKK